MNSQIALANIAILSIFTLVYILLYRKQKQFAYNRFYILSSLLLSVLIPFIQLDLLPYDVFLQPNLEPVKVSSTIMEHIESKPTPISIIPLIYWTGFAIGLIILIINITKHAYLVWKSKFKKEFNCQISSSPTSQTFSFFKYIFLSDDDELKKWHEVAHGKYLHTWDRILMAILICFCWFNPLVYIYRYFLIENHEFAADEYAINQQNIKKSAYGEFLLKNTQKRLMVPALNNQFNSLIKNRIMILLNDYKTNRWAYILMLPLFLGVFSAFTIKAYPVYKEAGNQTQSIDTIPGKYVVIDTITTFDPRTNKEEIVIVRNFGNAEESFRNTELSGKTVSWRDTIISFNPQTKKEDIVVVEAELPEEYLRVYNLLDYNQQNIALQKYGKVTRHSLKSPENNITLIDTIAVFDLDTKKESIQVVKRDIDLNEYLNELDFSGEEIEVVDTIQMYDYDTFNESTTIAVATYPKEFEYILNSLNINQQNIIDDQFRKLKSLKYVGDMEGNLYIEKNNNGLTFDIHNEKSGFIKSIDVPAGKKSLPVKSLGLPSGNYELINKGDKSYKVILSISK